MNLNLTCPVTDKTSYGIVSLNLIQAMNRLGVTCAVHPISKPSPINQFDYDIDLLRRSVGAAKSFDYNAPSLKIWHATNFADSVGRGPRVGFPIFELNKFTPEELHQLNSLDLILVCSEWAKTIVSAQTNVPCEVVPLGVDADIFSPKPPKTKSSFVFFTTGKYEVRKGHNELVEAFNLAFDESDNVELWMSIHNVFMNSDELKEIHNRFRSTRLGSKIKFVGPFSSQQQLANIMNNADCGVFPSHSEGWGMGTLEMMSCGKQVIATNYGGFTEYCNGLNSKLLPSTGLQSANDGVWFNGFGEWSSFSTDKLAELMWAEFANGPIVNTEGIKTAKKFSWDNSAERLKNAFQKSGF